MVATRKRATRKRKAAHRAVLDPESALAQLAHEPDPRRRASAARLLLSRRPLAAEPIRSAGFSALANALVEAGDREGARREWLRMAVAGLSPVRACIEAGLIAEESGRLSVAEADYKRAAHVAKSLGDRAEAWAALARFYVRAGTPERALPLLRSKAKSVKHPLIVIARAFVEARISRDPAPLEKHRGTMKKMEREIPIFGYFLAFLELWDGRSLEAVRALRSFVSRGVDATTSWGRELAPEIDHARRTILQLEAIARVPMP